MPHVDSAGARIWWESRGSGDPIVLINGLSSASEAWFRVVPHLERTHRVITIDNRGVGKSDAPRGRYTVTTMAQDVLAVMDAAGIQTPHVMGISMGSCIAQEVALLAPDRVRSLVLAASNPGTRHSKMPAPKVMWLVSTGGLRDYQRFNEKLTPYVYHPSTPRSRVDEDMRGARSVAPSRRGLRGQTLGCMGWDRFGRLRDIKTRTLVLHGADDLLDPAVNAETLAAAMPDAQLAVLPNASHQLFTDQEEAAMAAVSHFIGARVPATD